MSPGPVSVSGMPFTEKYLRTPGVVEIAGRLIKRYHVNTVDAEIEDEVREAAYAFVPGLLPKPDDTPPATFVVLHRGRDAAYVNAYSWVWDNVIECRSGVAGIPMLGCEDTDPTNFVALDRPWIGCIWELPPLEHERSAWVRHVFAPEEPDLAGYLADMFPAGRVGGPTTGM
jgi:hypothetical protein